MRLPKVVRIPYRSVRQVKSRYLATVWATAPYFGLRGRAASPLPGPFFIQINQLPGLPGLASRPTSRQDPLEENFVTFFDLDLCIDCFYSLSHVRQPVQCQSAKLQ